MNCKSNRMCCTDKFVDWFISWIRKHLLDLVIVPIITGLAVSRLWGWFNDINPEKIALILPYAYEYKYPDGKTYKNSENSDEKSAKVIDDKIPIPLLYGKETKLTLGIANINRRSLHDVTLYLVLPEEIQITSFDNTVWIKYADNKYYARVNVVINNQMPINISKPVYITANKIGTYKIKYNISGFDIKRIDRTIPILVYSNPNE